MGEQKTHANAINWYLAAILTEAIWMGKIYNIEWEVNATLFGEWKKDMYNAPGNYACRTYRVVVDAGEIIILWPFDSVDQQAKNDSIFLQAFLKLISYIPKTAFGKIV